MEEKSARIVSLVPSWTETMLWAGLNVVGRTRFCIHPETLVNNIPAVGGTKGADVKKISDLHPDFVILDREENQKDTADQLADRGIKTIVSHIHSLESAGNFLEHVGQLTGNVRLKELAGRYKRLPLQAIWQTEFFKQSLIKGTLNDFDQNNFEYVIWKNPFMIIGQNTFIADVLRLAGLNVKSSEKYPKIADEELKKSFCLLSSEPYPFLKDVQKMRELGFRAAVIDGEKISWYGIRNLLFLESCQKLNG